MIINSLSLAVAIVAALLALVFCVMAIQGTLRDRRERLRGNLIDRLEDERAKQERQRLEQHPAY